MICGANDIVEHYEKRIKIFLRADLTGPGTAIQAHLPKRLCPVRSDLKRTPVQDFNSFSVMFYYIISTTYQKIEDLLYFWTFTLYSFPKVLTNGVDGKPSQFNLVFRIKKK